MTDPNVTDPVRFADRYGNAIRMSGDYGRLVLDGRVELDGDRLTEFMAQAAAMYLEARDLEAARFRDEAEAAAEAAADLEDACPVVAVFSDREIPCVLPRGHEESRRHEECE